ncbi:hypothetical protein SDC9_200208 [bioreactor metagenome]|uniref:Flagellar protein FliT n=1 Tax=bioreactor metagenome TaxID=1076179 RepID=A0A645IN93_9ZZZZ
MEKIEKIDKEIAMLTKCAPNFKSSAADQLALLLDQQRNLYQELSELNQKTSKKVQNIAGEAKDKIKKITRQKIILSRYGHDSHSAGILLDFKDGK